jgi:alpha-amylase
MRNVTLHAFNWQYQEIIKQLDEIQKSGYGAILIPPPLYSDFRGESWWQRYQPKDYRILLSYLGGKKDLEELIQRCHAANPPIQVYVDIVLNHMANENRSDHYNFPGEAELQKYRDNPTLFADNQIYGDLKDGLFSASDFNRRGEIDGGEWSNRDAVQNENLSGLPDLNDSPWVLEQQMKMLKALVDMGFDGFRIDAIKHLTERTIDSFADNKLLSGKFLFGEVLTGGDQDEQIFLTPFLQETWIAAYDFPLFNTMREAFNFGGSLKKLAYPANEGNALPWHRSVTFVVNHDIPYNNGFRSWLFDRQDEHLAHAYILGKDGGVPLIFSDHNESTAQFPEDFDRWQGSFNRPDIVDMINFHNAVQGTTMSILYVSDSVLVFRRGERGIVAINKGGQEQSIEFNTWGLQNPGAYQDLLHKHEMKLSGNSFELFIPGRTAQMWLAT